MPGQALQSGSSRDFYSVPDIWEGKEWPLVEELKEGVLILAVRGDLHITKNLKMVEWLKAELIDSVGVLFKSLLQASVDATSDALATLIILLYLLGSRVGVPFMRLDREIRHKLKQSLSAVPADDQWHQDMAGLTDYLDHRSR